MAPQPGDRVRRGDGNWQDLPNATVALTLIAHDSTGGHLHVGDKPAGTLSKTSVTTGYTGSTSVTFTVPEASGPVTIVGSSRGAADDSIDVQIGWFGLAGLGATPDIALTGAVTHFHEDNHYGTFDANTAFTALARYIHVLTGQKAMFNDMSLPLGGLFETRPDHAAWTIPHSTHRDGLAVDVDNAFYYADLSEVERFWSDYGTYVPENSHMHFNFRKLP